MLPHKDTQKANLPKPFLSLAEVIDAVSFKSSFDPFFVINHPGIQSKEDLLQLQKKIGYISSAPMSFSTAHIGFHDGRNKEKGLIFLLDANYICDCATHFKEENLIIKYDSISKKAVLLSINLETMTLSEKPYNRPWMPMKNIDLLKYVSTCFTNVPFKKLKEGLETLFSSKDVPVLYKNGLVSWPESTPQKPYSL